MVLKKTILFLAMSYIMLTGCSKINTAQNTETLSQTYTENDIESNEIFLGEIDNVNDYNENDFNIDSETAMSNVVDSLIAIDMWPENANLLCSGVILSNDESYYQVNMFSENEYVISTIGTFCVNTTNGTVYLKFDPTLDALRYFAPIADEIDEDDGRTRLVKLSK